MGSKYFIDADDALEAFLDSALAEIGAEAAACPASGAMKFLLLGGGYGRGEGGILRRGDGAAALYNDLDFFVIVRDGAARREILMLDEWFAALSGKWTKKLGVDADFGAAQRESYVLRRLDRMMWRDMALGSKAVCGSQDAFEASFGAAAKSSSLRRGEAAKLMFNRCYGLLLAKKRLFAQNPADSDFDFIARNINKALLACMEVLLMMRGRCPAKAADRLEAFAKLDPASVPGHGALAASFAGAVDFKRGPKISADMGIQRARHAAASETTLAVLDCAESFLFQGGGRGIRDILRDAKNSAVLSSEFGKLGARTGIFGDPILQSLKRMRDMIETQKEPGDRQMQALSAIWGMIN